MAKPRLEYSKPFLWECLIRLESSLCWSLLAFCLPDFDANNIFKAFFGGPGGFSFEGKLWCDVFVLRIQSAYLSYWFVWSFFQHLDQEISSSSLVNWKIHLPKLLHQDFSTMSTPDPPSIFNDWLRVRFLSMPFTEWMQSNDHMQQKI